MNLLARYRKAKIHFTTKDTKSTKFGVLIIRALRVLRGEKIFFPTHCVAVPGQCEIKTNLIHRHQLPVAMLDSFARHLHAGLRGEDEAVA